MAFFLQIAWAVGCVAWNLYGLWLIKQGQRPIGPTATLFAAGLCVVFGLLFWLLRKSGKKWPYVIVSAFAGVMALYAAYGGVSQDPSLWPSEFWRIAGIVLNGMGGIACMWAIIGALREPQV